MAGGNASRTGEPPYPLETPFTSPDEQEVVNKLLSNYDDPKLRKPAHVIYLLDFSGSIKGPRITALRSAFAGLSGADNSPSGKFVRFYKGEEVTIMRFGGRILDEKDFTIGGPGVFDSMRDFIATDDFDGSTAIWSALDHAYQKVSDIVHNSPGQSTSVVLMTDGENNAGTSTDEFLGRYASLSPESRAVHTYTIRLGEDDAGELLRVARVTGGHMVDATAIPLLDAFKEIRGCD